MQNEHSAFMGVCCILLQESRKDHVNPKSKRNTAADACRCQSPACAPMRPDHAQSMAGNGRKPAIYRPISRPKPSRFAAWIPYGLDMGAKRDDFGRNPGALAALRIG